MKLEEIKALKELRLQSDLNRELEERLKIERFKEKESEIRNLLATNNITNEDATTTVKLSDFDKLKEEYKKLGMKMPYRFKSYKA